MSEQRKPILCVDFDGVVHSYTSGWQGADVIPDPPVPGALEFIVRALEHFELHIFSSRSNQPGGQRAMQKYLLQHYRQLALYREETPDWLRRYIERYECSWDAAVIQATLALTCNDIRWPNEKPPAFLTIDDRCITFDGTWPSLDELVNFKPWYKRESAATAAPPGLTARELARDTAFQEALERYANGNGPSETVAWCALRAIERAAAREQARPGASAAPAEPARAEGEEQPA